MKQDKQYRIAGAATWELIRAAYLSGDSARTCAERFGVSEHAIRKRVTVEKWTKRDYAAALEARGLEPPPKPKPLNVAERFAAHYQPPEPPPEPAHPFAELVEALKQASAAAQAAHAPEASPAESAAALEQRALAQASEALARGRAGDAKALTGIAEQMRKRAAEERAAADAQQHEEELDARDREEAVRELFCRVASLALSLLHEPATAPAMFLRMIKRWREINLGEGEQEAEARAAKIANSCAHYLKGDYAETMPEDVRAYMAARWSQMRAELGREEAQRERALP